MSVPACVNKVAGLFQLTMAEVSRAIALETTTRSSYNYKASREPGYSPVKIECASASASSSGVVSDDGVLNCLQRHHSSSDCTFLVSSEVTAVVA